MRGAFGEEDVAQRLCLQGMPEADEGGTFADQGAVERFAGRSRDKVDGDMRRLLTRGAAVGQRMGGGDRSSLGAGAGRWSAAMARRRVVGRQGEGGCHRIIGQRIDQAQLPRFRCGHAAALTDKVKGCDQADHPGQSLRGPRPRDEAERHFRLAQARIRCSDAHPAGERNFQSAAEGGPGNRGDCGEGQVQQFRQHIIQVRCQRRPVEFLRIGPGDKCLPGPGQDQTASGRSDLARAIAVCRPARIACPKTFSGGLSNVMTAASP